MQLPERERERESFGVLQKKYGITWQIAELLMIANQRLAINCLNTITIVPRQQHPDFQYLSFESTTVFGICLRTKKIY